jgi:pSer/pThr/pTyr-binding forkhead associated (FHA) protein
MPSIYCSRCGRPNPADARFCSSCGAPLVRSDLPTGPATGGFAAVPDVRPGETTSTLSLNRDDEAEAEPYPQFAVDALPPGSALLVVLRGPNAGSRFLLDRDVTTAGRHPDSDIFLDDVTVSRRHAEFYRQGARFLVRDVGSLNGTYVGRERIDEAELADGAEVQIGKFRLLFLSRSPEFDRYSGPGAQGYA